MNKKCHLCSEMAEYHIEGSSEIVSCPECGKYETTTFSRKYFLKEDVLEQADFNKLSNYVKKKFDPETKEAVLLSPKIITKVTGKRSVERNYV